MDQEEKMSLKEETQSMTQWIVSLAISIVCCSVLFLIFAGYIMDLHNSATLAKVHIEVMQDRLNRLTSEVDLIRRPSPIIQINGASTSSSGEQVPASVNIVEPVPAVPATPAEMPVSPKMEEKTDPAKTTQPSVPDVAK